MRRLIGPVVTCALVVGTLAAIAGPPPASAAAPPRPVGIPYWPGWDIARAVAVAPDGTSGMVLDGFGGLHPFGIGGRPAPPTPRTDAYWPGWDIARGVALRSATSGYVLDGFGGVHPFGGAPAVNRSAPAPYLPGADWARGITLTALGTGAYVVGRTGGLSAFGIGAGAAPEDLRFPVSLSIPIAADVAMLTDDSGALVLDGIGGFHRVGIPSAVPVGPLPYWPGWDIARGVALLPDRSGGFVLDGFGGLHPIALGDGDPQLNQSVFLAGLANPWDLGFTPDGWVVLTERPIGISAVRVDGSGRRRLLTPPDLLVASEAGAMGLAVDPDFATNRRVYVCFGSRAAGRADDVRLVRFRVNDDWSGLSQRADLVTGLPINPVGQLGRHSGCRPRFGPDGYLWVGTGDAAVGTVPQDLHSLGGKILRVDTDGAAARDNPFYFVFGDPRIYSFGHRNVQGLAFAPDRPDWIGLSVEHGPDVDDEVNRLVPGNFGWDPVPGYNESVPMTDLFRYPDAVSAVWSSGNPTIAPAGATFLTGGQWRTWQHSMAVAVLKGSHLRIFLVRPDGSIRATLVRMYAGVRLRTPVEGPDGNLYVTTDNRPGGDLIYRIVPS